MIRDELQALVDKQAEDEVLWSVPFDRLQPITEAYLQQGLRKLHAAIEARTSETEQPDDSTLELGAIEHFIKREIPDILLRITEIDADSEDEEITISKALFDDIYLCLEGCKIQLAASRNHIKRESGDLEAVTIERDAWKEEHSKILDDVTNYMERNCWQPIKTAPKDGEQTCILAWAETRDGGCSHLHGVYQVFWDDIENAWLIASSMRRIENDAWHLTWWQPCPEPPLSKIEDQSNG